ncbi:MAG: hypothetical protein PUF36_00210 [Prevotella sp.]|nr:hypothetical protein [Prevotella sp.]
MLASATGSVRFSLTQYLLLSHRVALSHPWQKTASSSHPFHWCSSTYAHTIHDVRGLFAIDMLFL